MGFFFLGGKEFVGGFGGKQKGDNFDELSRRKEKGLSERGAEKLLRAEEGRENRVRSNC